MATRFYSIFVFSLILPIAGCNSATQPNAASRPEQTTTVASSTTGLGSIQERSSESSLGPLRIRPWPSAEFPPLGLCPMLRRIECRQNNSSC